MCGELGERYPEAHRRGGLREVGQERQIPGTIVEAGRQQPWWDSQIEESEY